uniref:Protein amnionless n=1 Tax=Timema cristinae TaxID=61476 RepID=A0A7R9GXH4_TIMCR|nr:unnamed protein product [Timema cristinae]
MSIEDLYVIHLKDMYCIVHRRCERQGYICYPLLFVGLVALFEPDLGEFLIQGLGVLFEPDLSEFLIQGLAALFEPDLSAFVIQGLFALFEPDLSEFLIQGLDALFEPDLSELLIQGLFALFELYLSEFLIQGLGVLFELDLRGLMYPEPAPVWDVLDVIMFRVRPPCSAYVNGVLKVWWHNTNFKNPANWDVNREPCSKDKVVFPSELQMAVSLPDGDTTLRGLVLPRSGELILPLEGSLTVTGDHWIQNDEHSGSAGLDVRFTRWQPLEWLNPDNWKGLGETEERYNPIFSMDFGDLHSPIGVNLSSPANPAIPHSDKVPCETDTVVFPGQSSFSITLPRARVSIGQMYFNGQRGGKTHQASIYQLYFSKEVGNIMHQMNTDTRIGQLYFSNELMSSYDWEDLLRSEAGERQFLASEDSRYDLVTFTETSCTDQTGCRCVSEAVQREICHNVQCEGQPPLCARPVRPLGHCCDVCGAHLLLEYNSDFKIAALRDRVERYLNEGKFSDVTAYVGKTTLTRQIQVVMVDKASYNGASSDTAKELATILEREMSLGVTRIVVYASGPAITSSRLAGAMSTMFGSLLAVVVVMGLIYLVFVVYSDKLNLLSSAEAVPFVFARFGKEAEEEEEEEEVQSSETGSENGGKVQVDTGRAQHWTSLPQAFDNPMFGKTNAEVSHESPAYSSLRRKEDEDEEEQEGRVKPLHLEEIALEDRDD